MPYVSKILGDMGQSPVLDRYEMDQRKRIQSSTRSTHRDHILIVDTVRLGPDHELEISDLRVAIDREHTRPRIELEINGNIKLILPESATDSELYVSNGESVPTEILECSYTMAPMVLATFSTTSMGALRSELPVSETTWRQLVE